MAKSNENILDKNTPIPLYFQLKKILKEKIETGELEPGDLLPSERELKEKYQISRPTIRQALNELVNEGLVYREKGKGTFVAKPKINYGFIQKFTTFYDDMEEKGFNTKTKIIKMEVKSGRKALAKKLNIEENDRIIVINRLRFIEGEPIVSVINHIPYKLCPELVEEDLKDKSLYRIMADKFGIVPYRAQITLEPIVAEEFDTKLLDIKVGSPMQLMQNITYTSDEVIMDYYESRFRGDKGKVKVELHNEI